MSQTLFLSPPPPLSLSSTSLSLLPHSSHFSKPTSHFPNLTLKSKKPCKTRTQRAQCKSFDKEQEVVDQEEEEWLKKLPEKNKALYAHSLMCIEAWLRHLGFRQRGEDPAAWMVEKGDWHAWLNLDLTDLSIRYLKNGPGNLEKDVERRFSYALSREDIENAILGGP